MRRTILRLSLLARDIFDPFAIRRYRWGKYRERLLNTTSNDRNSRLLRASVIRGRRRDASFLQIRASNSLLDNRPFDQRHVTSKFRLDRTIDTFVRHPQCSGGIIDKRFKIF